MNGSGNDNVKWDFKGCVIDCDPPKPREPTKHERNGHTEYWCGSCPKGGHWGNHNNNIHKKFLEKNKKWKEAQKRKGKCVLLQRALPPILPPATPFLFPCMSCSLLLLSPIINLQR